MSGSDTTCTEELKNSSMAGQGGTPPSDYENGKGEDETQITEKEEE